MLTVVDTKDWMFPLPFLQYFLINLLDITEKTCLSTDQGCPCPCVHYLGLVCYHGDVIKWKLFLRYSHHRGPVMRTFILLWCGSKKAVKQTVEWPVIWDHMTFMWRHRNDTFWYRCFLYHMSIIAHRITGISTIYSTNLGLTTKKLQCSAFLALCEGNMPVTVGFSVLPRIFSSAAGNFMH